MKVMVIGGTGLISSAVVQRLAARGDQVTIFNRGSGRRAVPPNVRVVLGDRDDKEALDRAIASMGPWDCVIDMICFRPDQVEASLAAVRGRTGQFVFTSTIDVYRKPASVYPYTEAEPFGGLGQYAIDKVACERLLWAAAERGDVPLTVIRPGATYGPGHGPVHIFGGAYVDRLLKGKPIVVHGDGSSFWPSLYADDLAAGYAGAVGNPQTIGRAFHMTGEEWLTWDQHHAVVAEAIGAPPPRIIHIATDTLARLAPDWTSWIVDNFQFNNLFDNRAARAELGFRYTIPLREGAARWFAAMPPAERQDSDGDAFEDDLIARWERTIGE